MTVREDYKDDESMAILDIRVIASFFEGAFSLDWLIQLTGRKATLLLEKLENACAEGLLDRQPYGWYSFRNNSDRMSYQRSVSRERSDTLRLRAIDIALEEASDEVAKADLIVRQMEDMKNSLKKCQWLSRAGDIYSDELCIDRAVQCYGAVLNAIPALDGSETDDLFVETALKYTKIADYAINVTENLSILQSALKRARRSGNKGAAALLNMHLAKHHWYQSSYSDAMGYFKTGWQAARRLSDSNLKQSAVTFSTFFHYWQGLFQKAVSIYEKEVPEMDKYPQGGFPVMAAATVGYCYSLVGQVPMGLGMVGTIQSISSQNGWSFMRTYSDALMADMLLGMHRTDEAMALIERSCNEAGKDPENPLLMFCILLQSYAGYLVGDRDLASSSLNKYVQLQARLQLFITWPLSYFLELSWAIEQGRLDPVPGHTLQEEIDRALQTKNIFLTGVAYRYQAFMLEKQGSPEPMIRKSLEQSERWLKQSGHQLELARTRSKLASLHFKMNREEMGRKTVHRISKELQKTDFPHLPVDLKAIPDLRSNKSNHLDHLIQASGEAVDASNDTDRLYHLLTSAGRMLGAERGAILSVDSGSGAVSYKILVGMNIIPEQMDSPAFSDGAKAIRNAIEKQQGQVLNLDTESPASSDIHIQSLICMPIRAEERLLGLIYLDKRILIKPFQKNDLRSLAVVGALISLTMQKQGQGRGAITLSAKDARDGPGKNTFHGMIGESAVMEQVYFQINQVAETAATVLILGETGVGKELAAQAIHEKSARKNGPFVAVNCNALPDTLISSELFGHEKGAFTDAHEQRIGRFELANNGTLFIDEIGEMPLETQVRLLRVLQTKDFERVGGNRTITSDFRLIVATNRKLDEEVRRERFRADLFYRLSTFPIIIPPLDIRKGDIPLLVNHFIKVYSTKMGKKIQSVPGSEMSKLVNHHWMGNVRELEHVVERSIILSSGSTFHVPLLENPIVEKPELLSNTETSLEGLERLHIIRTLDQTNWKVRGAGGAAEILDIHPSTLYSKLNRLGIQKPARFERRK